jgi:3-deoxy-D-manno-octulosonic-acid transferase
MYLLYSMLLFLSAIISSPYWIFKAITQNKYCKSFWRRLGIVLPEKTAATKPLWLHAVSVGEILAAKPLVSAIHASYPDLPLVISTVTLTGQALARREFAAAANIIYFPFDFSYSIRRFLKCLHPRAVLLMETELWPNFLNCCRRQGIPVLLANGRISDNSFVRYRGIKILVKPMLRSLRSIGVQTEESKARFLELGAAEDRVVVTGNLKFDYAMPAITGESEWLNLIAASLGPESKEYVIVAGSTMKGEEALLIDAFRKVHSAVPQAHLVLAPRHPERFDEVANLLAQSGIRFLRRSRLGASLTSADIILLDTMGELRVVYTLASIAVIGGSFLPFGGHNPLEPAALGKAIIFGPEMSNFKEISNLFLREHAAHQCSTADLPIVLTELLRNADARNALGQRAYSTLKKNQGATISTLNLLSPYLS